MRPMIPQLLVATIAATLCGQLVAAAELELAAPQTLIAAPGMTPEFVLAQTLAARRYATFWSSGSPDFARAALAPDFNDRTLPPGRQQGIVGALAASAAFHAAVPDLNCEIQQIIISGDRVVSHLRFTGHFTGTFNGKQGQGQAVDFIATDIYRIADGRIAENWHLEDNLTFMQQIGAVVQ